MSIQPFEDLEEPQRIYHNPAHDKEARTVDSLVESAAEPPTKDKAPKDETPPLRKPKPVDRMLSGTLTMNLGDPPVMLQPASPFRKHFRMTASSATNTDFVRFADDSGKLQMKSASGVFTVGIEAVELNDYTGPIWVAFAEGTGPVTITWIAIAEGLDK